MPILEVEIVLRPDETLPDRLALDLAEAAGEIFASPPGGTWVRLRGLPRAHYAENGGGPPEGVFPVFVTVLKAHLPPPAGLAAEAARLAAAVGAACGRQAENVHLLYLPPAAGRMAFGGKLVAG